MMLWSVTSVRPALSASPFIDSPRVCARNLMLAPKAPTASSIGSQRPLEYFADQPIRLFVPFGAALLGCTTIVPFSLSMRQFSLEMPGGRTGIPLRTGEQSDLGDPGRRTLLGKEDGGPPVPEYPPERTFDTACSPSQRLNWTGISLPLVNSSFRPALEQR